MFNLNRGLSDRAERYLLSRDVSNEYAQQIRFRVASFVAWIEGRGHSETLVDTTAITDEVNAWLADMKARQISPHTIDGYRRAFMAVWNNADNPDAEHPPLRLRKIRKPQCVVQAYTHDEIRALLHAADRLKGRHPDDNRRSDYWVALIEAAYSTGLRRGDLIGVQWSIIQQDGRATVIQHKTNYPVNVRFSNEAMTRMRRLTHTEGRAMPYPYYLGVFWRTFDKLIKTAEIERGSFKWLRRAAGSYAEREKHGNGSLLLGHRCEKVFRANYEDTTISRPDEITPPSLLTVRQASYNDWRRGRRASLVFISTSAVRREARLDRDDYPVPVFGWNRRRNRSRL